MSGNKLIGWRGSSHGEPTTVVLLRHGVTASTVRKLFCGSGGLDPELTDEGHQQAARAAAWIAAHHDVDALISSPLQRTQQTAAHVAEATQLTPTLEPGFSEAAFGDWDGHSFAEVAQQWGTELEQWLGSTSVAPPNGESFDSVDARVAEARNRIVAAHPGETVVVTSHVTPIKMSIRQALDAPMPIIYKMELAPASITTIQWWPDGAPSLRNFSVVPD